MASRLVYMSCRSIPLNSFLACNQIIKNNFCVSNFFLKRATCFSLKNPLNFTTLSQCNNPCYMCSKESELSFIHFLTLKRVFSKSSLASRKKDDIEQEEDDLETFDPNEEKMFEKWSRELLPLADKHSVLVIQPYIKWGANKKLNTTPELQLEEAVALVQSLHGWQVVDKMAIGLISYKKKTFFGSGNFEILKKKVRNNERITAVFISTKILMSAQHRELQSAFRVPVFDRYTIIIHLFRQHAITREAKLQVAMAEIPYMWSQLKDRDEGTKDKRGGSGGKIQGVGGGGETVVDIQQHALAIRETKLKQALEKLRKHRTLLRSKRKKLEYPVVAVVGYTNAGKTSLIKALTGDESIEPKDKLFATLDVTNHMGVLPCRMKVLYVDTVGFISDIPTNLLESFVATLEDALFADVILHVVDVSHPDQVAQAENVNKTLQNLQVSPDTLKNIITVGNKIDLVSNDLPFENIGIPVSAVQLSGLESLKKRIEEAILQATDRKSLVIRVPMGGKEASWLYKEATVTETEADPVNNQFLLMHVVITNAQLSRFQYYFVTNRSNPRQKIN